MRIAWILYGSLDQKTGGTLYDGILVNGLGARGHHVDVISIDRGCDVDALAARSRIADVLVGDELCFDEIGRLFSRVKRDRAGCRVLLVHHLTRWEKEIAPTFRVLVGEARALRHADLVIATSRESAARLAREELRNDAVVIEPGADRCAARSRDRESTTRRADVLTLLFVGSIIARKRLMELLLALDELHESRARLVVIGEPRDRAYASLVERRIAASPYLRAHVELRGAASDADLCDAFGRADAFVSSASFEGYGMALAEALFAAVPAIASDTGAARAICGDASLLFPPGNFSAMKDMIARFFSDESLRRDLRSRAAMRASHLPRWDDAVTAFEALLARELARSSPRGASRPRV